jgi:hypothetical protein
MSSAITGQIEALLPQYFAAKAALETAQAHLDEIKESMIGVIETPQTVVTSWGSVTLNNGRTTYVYDNLTKAQIKVLQETAIAQGAATQKKGENFITVRAS